TDNFESLDVGHEMNDQNELKKDMVTIDLTGKDDVDFLEIKSSIEEEIKKNSFKLEVVQETNEFDDKWIFSPNTQKLAQHQLSQSQLTQQLRSFFVPHELMQVRMY